jgi:hypothetical protein
MVLPVLMAILLWAQAGGAGPQPPRGSPRPRGYWRPALVMLATVAVVLVPRTLVLGGLGGYGGQSLTPVRGAGALASFILAAFSAPQLDVLRHPALFLVPLGALAILVIAVYAAWRGRAEGNGGGTGTARARLALAGIAWFLVALVPVLNQPLNLNTANGDRLLFLPSVGLAIAVGVLVGGTRRAMATAAWGAVAALCAVSCVLVAMQWRTAGTESRRLIGEIDRLAPRGAHVFALSVPSDYRTAHLYPDGLELAVQETGRPDVTLTGCMPVQALSLRPRQVSFLAVPGGLWFGRTTPEAPFEVPVLGSSQAQPSIACVFGKGPHRPRQTLGTALAAFVVTTPSRHSYYMYFDGRDMRPAG